MVDHETGGGGGGGDRISVGVLIYPLTNSTLIHIIKSFSGGWKYFEDPECLNMVTCLDHRDSIPDKSDFCLYYPVQIGPETHPVS